MHIKKKEERVLDGREKKAERIAALEQSIERELLSRLKEVRVRVAKLVVF